MTSHYLETAIKKLSYSYFAISLSAFFLTGISLLNYFSGFAVLLFRRLGMDLFPFKVIFPSCFFLVILMGLFKAQKSSIPKLKWLAILDDFNDLGGLLVSSTELSGYRLLSNARPIAIPRFKVDYSTKIGLLFLSSFFLLLCLFLPIKAHSVSDNTLDLHQTESLIEEQISTLHKESLISDTELDTFFQSLKQISHESEADNPSKSFEALDHLRDKLKKIALSSAVQMAASNDNYQKMLENIHQIPDDSLKNTLSYFENAKIQDEQKQFDRQEAEKQLKQYIESHSKKTQNTIANLAQQGLIAQHIEQQLSKSAPTQQKSEQIINFQNAEPKSSESPNTSLPDAQEEKQSTASGDSEPTDSSKSSAQNTSPQEGDSGQSTEQNEQNTAGSKSDETETEGDSTTTGSTKAIASPSDGASDNSQMLSQPAGLSGSFKDAGGHAPLLFNRKTSEHKAKYQDHLVPTSEEIDYENSVSIGIRMAAPSRQHTEPEKNSTTIEYDKINKIHNPNEIILPKHKNAVKNYFGGVNTN